MTVQRVRRTIQATVGLPAAWIPIPSMRTPCVEGLVPRVCCYPEMTRPLKRQGPDASFEVTGTVPGVDKGPPVFLLPHLHRGCGVIGSAPPYTLTLTGQPRKHWKSQR